MFTKSNVAVTGARLVLAFGEFEYLPQCKICAATGGLLLVYVIFMLPIPGHHVTMCKDHFIHKTWNKNNTRVNWYQKGKNQSGFTGARYSEWQWHQLGHIQICTLTQTDNHTSIPPLCFLQVGFPSCRPTNSIKALKYMTLQCCQRTEGCR